jgi:hypothetical protein
MVTQVLADAGEILDHIDTKQTQFSCGAEPRAHKNSRGVECSRTEADLATLVFCLSARGSDTDARGALSVEDDPVHEGVTKDGEIGTTARGLEIAVIRRHAPACAAVHGVGGDSGAVRRVVVLCPGIPQVQRRRPEGAVEGPPLFDECSVHRDWSSAPMVRCLGEVEVILKLAKSREHLAP